MAMTTLAYKLFTDQVVSRLKSTFIIKILEDASLKINTLLSTPSPHFLISSGTLDNFNSIFFNISPEIIDLDKLSSGGDEVQLKTFESITGTYKQIGKPLTFFVHTSQLFLLFETLIEPVMRKIQNIPVPMITIIDTKNDWNITIAKGKIKSLEIGSASDVEFFNNKISFKLKDVYVDLWLETLFTVSRFDEQKNSYLRVKTWRQRFARLIPGLFKKFDLDLKKTFETLHLDVHINKKKKTRSELCSYYFPRQLCPISPNNMLFINNRESNSDENVLLGYVDLEISIKQLNFKSDSHISINGWKWTKFSFMRGIILKLLRAMKNSIAFILSKVLMKELLKVNVPFNFGDALPMNKNNFLIQLNSEPIISSAGIKCSARWMKLET